MSLHNLKPGGPICPICKTHPARVLFCPHCGQRVVLPCRYCSQSPTQCPHCGKMLS